MNTDRPILKAGRMAIPDYAISAKWLEKDDNANMVTSLWTHHQDNGFTIADEEIHAYDLEALNTWADDERDD